MCSIDVAAKKLTDYLNVFRCFMSTHGTFLLSASEIDLIIKFVKFVTSQS